MATEIDVVRDVSRKLDQGGIGYMLTGSMAMNYYAQPRMTRDIDVVVAIGPNDVEQMASLFKPEYATLLMRRAPRHRGRRCDRKTLKMRG